MDPQTLSVAVVEWVNTFESNSRRCHNIRDLADGAVFYEILSEIDSQWFSLVRSIDTGDNWVLKFNNLKKLYKVLIGFYEEVLGQNTAGLEVPNLTSIARDADVIELLKLSQLIIALAVQCENNQKYIAKIQSLSQQSQHSLMLAIEMVMGRLANANAANMSPITKWVTASRFRYALPGLLMCGWLAEFSDGNAELPVPAAFIAEKMELEQTNKALEEQLDQLRNKYEELVLDRGDLRSRLQDMEQSVSHLSEAGKIDFILRTEIDNLKSDLSKSENKRLDAEAMVEKQNGVIAELTRKVEDAAKKAEETSRLKDQLDEFRHMADKLQKSEAIIDKYKKKLEEVGDLRKQMKSLEEQNQQQAERNSQLEEEYRKVSSFKPLMDTYKEQIGELESKNSSLQVENSTLQFQLNDARTKIERYESERRVDHETIQTLEDRIKDMELQGGGGMDFSGHIPDELGGVSDGALKAKVAQLERELERLRVNKGDADKVVVLENLLEDANRLKAKFEQDYRQSYERTLALENEIQQLRSVSNVDGSEEIPSLRAKISEYETQIQALQRRLGDAESNVSSRGSASPTGAPSEVLSAGIPSDYEKLKKQIKQLTEDQRNALAQVNKLMHEKEKKENELIETKELLHQQQRTASDLRSALAAMESQGQSSDETTQKLGSVAQKLAQVTDQNQALHLAVKRAKEHILLQEKQLKERTVALPKDNNYSEAIGSYETMLKERDQELERVKRELADTRIAAKREQRLILSAWNNLGTDLQRTNVTQRSGGTSMSWLAQQRRQLGSQMKRR
ncbi:hypothetical protein HK104_007134 [Borealophlyctis nickersoniae]|nr:hypothetical protein HK104_007134 [Borealophlyctis nickersoniae]